MLGGETQHGTETRGVRGSWLIQALSGRRAHPGGVFTRNTPPANTSPMAGAASRGWQDIGHTFIFVLLLSLRDVSAFGHCQGEDAGICGPLFYHSMASDVFSEKSGPN